MRLFVDFLGTLFFSGPVYVLPWLLRLATLLQPLDQTLTTSLYTKFVVYFHRYLWLTRLFDSISFLAA